VDGVAPLPSFLIEDILKDRYGLPHFSLSLDFLFLARFLVFLRVRFPPSCIIFLSFFE